MIDKWDKESGVHVNIQDEDNNNNNREALLDPTKTGLKIHSRPEHEKD